MCVVKKPKVQAAPANSDKPPVYLTNPFLDDPGNRAIAFGRNALRIDPRGSTVSAPIRIDPINSAPLPPPVNPGLGIGDVVVGGGGGGGTGYVREYRDPSYRSRLLM